jgi:hypothetical protein
MSWPPEIGELLPNAEKAYGVHEKLAEYSRKPGHARRKGEAFARALGVTSDDLDYVAGALLEGVRTTPMSASGLQGPYGFHCEVILRMCGLCDRADRTANVLTAWEIRADGNAPRLITAYIVSRVR